MLQDPKDTNLSFNVLKYVWKGSQVYVYKMFWRDPKPQKKLGIR